MRAKAGILIIMGLLLLVNAAGAADPYTITLTNTPNWIVANGVDKATFSVQVLNTSTPVEGALVTFSVNNSAFGSLNPVTNTTDVAGHAESYLTAGTRSGIAEITATMTYVDLNGDTYTATSKVYQNIDHDSPYVPIFTHATSGTIKTEVPVTITFKDRWGNLIDNRNPTETHTVSLHVHGPSPDDCGFVEGASYPHDVTKTLDAYGNISAVVSLTSTAGSNNILLDQFGSIPDKIRSITAISNAEPCYIDQIFDPNGDPYATVVADGVQTFTIRYVLKDCYQNPTSGQPFNLTTSAPEYYPDRLTSSTGDVWYTYGPKSFTGIYTITGTAVNNISVSMSKQVRFYNNSPSNVEVYASPQSMPSRDANPAIYSTISAKVVDIIGNPVSGETVTFTLHGVSYTPGTVNVTSNPSFSASSDVVTVSATTNADGIASTNFYPSAFAVYGETGYEQSATGTGTVTATWNGVQRDAELIWKNYPYLSALMDTSCDQKSIGDIIDVHLQLNGDGWAMTSKPIDVVLATDRSGSMGGTKITNAKNAAVLFTNNLTSQDNEGLVSFGGNYATTDQALTTDKAVLTSRINSYVANGYTPMRDAMYQSAYLIKNTARANSVRAIIVLTDGEWNTAGDPEGIITSPWSIMSLGDGVGTDSVIDYIEENDMKLFIIGLGVSTSYQAVLQGYVDDVGGGSKYYNAPTSDELAGIYTEIAGELRESAGVNTVAVMDFGSIVINDQLDTSGDVFAYVADPGNPGVTYGASAGTNGHTYGSTMIRKYNQTHELIPGPAYSMVGPLIDNMTGYWNSYTPHQLQFDIGEVKLNEVWETSFQLRVLKEGSISLMGPSSGVTFRDVNGDISSMRLNNLSTCSVAQDAQFTGATWQTLTISDFTRTDSANGDGDIGSILTVTWTTEYTGIRPVTHDVMFIHDDDPPVRFDQFVTSGSKNTLYAQLDMTKLPPGGYKIQVHAHSDDAEDIDTIGPWAYNTQKRAFIKLE